MSAPSFNQMQDAMRVVKRNTGPLPPAVVDLIGQALRHYCDALHPFVPEAAPPQRRFEARDPENLSPWGPNNPPVGHD